MHTAVMTWRELTIRILEQIYTGIKISLKLFPLLSHILLNRFHQSSITTRNAIRITHFPQDDKTVCGNPCTTLIRTAVFLTQPHGGNQQLITALIAIQFI